MGVVNFDGTMHPPPSLSSSGVHIYHCDGVTNKFGKSSRVVNNFAWLPLSTTSWSDAHSSGSVDWIYINMICRETSFPFIFCFCSLHPWFMLSYRRRHRAQIAIRQGRFWGTQRIKEKYDMAVGEDAKVGGGRKKKQVKMKFITLCWQFRRQGKENNTTYYSHFPWSRMRNSLTYSFQFSVRLSNKILLLRAIFQWGSTFCVTDFLCSGGKKMFWERRSHKEKLLELKMAPYKRTKCFWSCFLK